MADTAQQAHTVQQLLKFLPLQSSVDVSFWSELAERKLNDYKLSIAAVPISGWFGPSRYAQLPGQLQVDASSFTASGTAPGLHKVPGHLTIFNTVEAFRATDKQEMLKQAAQQLLADICSGAAEQDPAVLSRFSVISFANLKAFKFTYWFLFPALKPPAPFTVVSDAQTLQAALGDTLATKVCAACDAWRGLAGAPAGTTANSSQSSRAPAWLLTWPADGAEAEALPLAVWPDLAAQRAQRRVVALAVPDTSNMPSAPGWALRNVLLLAALRWRAPRLQVVCCRDVRGHMDAGRSLLLDVALPEVPLGWGASGAAGAQAAAEAVGWEANAEGRLLPREVDLSSLMSPQHLAEQAVDLNLHLMKWRAAPELDTRSVAATKCLLLGAGTLGCAVARTLLAWGVRHVTFVDSSRVSYSNPVRQSLFEFQDCTDGGKPKAQAAATALQRIFPLASSQGLDLSIPMPGHPPSSPAQKQAMQQAMQQLDELVQAHDTVFLLTDTRESRWLPTLLAAVHNRVAITSAVGFDSFLVMRHGAGPDACNDGGDGGPDAPALSGDEPQAQVKRPPWRQHARLGCYFCNDVVAPLNSTRDRTLDQQCTVARPGLAPIAGALAVELLVALEQHPLRQLAPPPQTDLSTGPVGGVAEGADADTVEEGVLGAVPHMVRGQLHGFHQTLMQGAAFSQCTACSSKVVCEYRRRGWQFVLEALQDPKTLEDLTGLTALQQGALDLLLPSGTPSPAASDTGSDQGQGEGPLAQPVDGAVPEARQALDEKGDDWTTL